jgi:hypothetical protein
MHPNDMHFSLIALSFANPDEVRVVFGQPRLSFMELDEAQMRVRVKFISLEWYNTTMKEADREANILREKVAVTADNHQEHDVTALAVNIFADVTKDPSATDTLTSFHSVAIGVPGMTAEVFANDFVQVRVEIQRKLGDSDTWTVDHCAKATPLLV